jgi:hypothetical protein
MDEQLPNPSLTGVLNSQSIMNLPAELLAHILTFCSFSDQVSAMTVSQSWHGAAQFAMKFHKGFIIGMCMGNKRFCEGIPDIGCLERLSEYSIRLSKYFPPGSTEYHSKLALLCPNVEVLCDSGCDSFVSMLLMRAYRTKLMYLQMDSNVKKIHEAGVFPVLKYLKFSGGLSKRLTNMAETFPVLEYLDGDRLTSDQLKSLPAGMKGIKLYFMEENTVERLSQSKVAATLQVLHIIAERIIDSVSGFSLPNLTDVSIRGLEDMDNLFTSLQCSKNIEKLHISARTCITVDHRSLLDTFAELNHLTSLNLRFIILEDPVSFWTRLVQLYGHKLQNLTFSSHFVTSESLNIMTGFAALQTLSLIFIYDQPFLYNNVPSEIRNRQPFTVADLLQFFRTPTASRTILRDVTVHMQSLGSDHQVIRDLESELQDMKQHHSLELAEVKEVGNRNSIFV